MPNFQQVKLKLTDLLSSRKESKVHLKYIKILVNITLARQVCFKHIPSWPNMKGLYTTSDLDKPEKCQIHISRPPHLSSKLVIPYGVKETVQNILGMLCITVTYALKNQHTILKPVNKNDNRHLLKNSLSI